MAERELAIVMRAKDLASGSIKRVTGNVNKLGGAIKRSHALSTGLGVGLERMGEAGLRAFGGAIKSGIDSLVTLEAANATTQAIIKSTGGVAKVSAVEVRTWANEIETATGAAIDDKAIQAAENVLLRSGSVTHDIFRRVSEDSVDLGAAMKKGPEAGAKTLAKALADPAKAAGVLRKANIFLSKTDQARIKDLVKHNKLAEAQALILGRVETATKGAALASAGPLAKSQHMLADAWEDAKIALATGFLPVLTKVANKLSTELAKPSTINAIRGLGDKLAGAFDSVVTASEKIPWTTIKDSLKIGADAAGTLIDKFNSVDPWIKTAVVTGWGLNKITGGAVLKVAVDLAKGAFDMFLGRGSNPANPLWVTPTTGGLPGGGAPGAPPGVVPPGVVLPAIGAAAVIPNLSEALGWVKEGGLAIQQAGRNALGAFPVVDPKQTGPARTSGPGGHGGAMPSPILAITGLRDKLSDLKKLQQTALARGDTKTAARIGREIQKLDANTAGRLSAVKAAVNAIPSPKTSVTVNSRVSVSTSISGRDVAHEVVQQSIRTHSGPGLGGDLGPK